MIEQIMKNSDEFARWRKDIHANPELGFEEQRTAELVACKLESWGFDEVHRNIAKTGVVGVLRGHTPSDNPLEKAIGLRADMDALPMQELNEFEHRSKHQGRMHACGHDGHTVMLLAAAWYLSEHRDFSGTVYFIFQPAEEGLAGAKAMIDEGLFDRFPCERIYGVHNMPGIPEGDVWVKEGPFMASTDRFIIEITGKGGHGAMPHQAIDPVVIMAELINALQTIKSRNVQPTEPLVVSITDAHAGSGTHNVIPETATLKGSIRAFNAEVSSLAIARMKQIAQGIALAHNAEINVTIKDGSYPATINNAGATQVAHQAAINVVGKDKVSTDFPPFTGSEDFAFFLQQVPGCYLFIGNGSEGKTGGVCVHNPLYDFNDHIIPIGASYFVELIKQEMSAN